MKNFLKLFISISFVLSVYISTNAQNAVDALRYSYIVPGGTARSSAMGGAFGALGADASVLSINPAGLGVYQGSDFTFSPGFVLNNSEANYMGTKRSDYNFNVNMNNIAYIGTIKSNNNAYTSFTLGFAYNRLNNFNQNIVIEAENYENSLTDWFAAKAQGINKNHIYDKDNFYSGLAWETYLIDPVSNTTDQYISVFDNRGQTQRELINKNGYMGEYAFSLAANISHQLYIGATLGIKSIRYSQTSTIEEIDEKDIITGFNSLRFKEYFETKGSGLNFKLGALFRPVKWIRFGGAIHTPTFYNLSDTYYTSLNSNFSEAPSLQDSIPIYEYSEYSKHGRFSYQLNTPFKAIASAAFILNRSALISIDYEFINYSQARLRSDEYAFYSENEDIKNFFTVGHNIRVGGEYRFGPISFRLGGSYYDSPYKSNHINKNSYNLAYSGGIGVRGSGIYFDISYTYITNENYYYLYQGYDVFSPKAKIIQNNNRIVTTLGFIF